MLQDVLGEHQDAVVAAERLRDLATRMSDTALAAGRLIEREQARARRGTRRVAVGVEEAREDGVVRAAGGIVARDGRLLLVHRPKYDDWTFPKGKAEPGESDEACAVREVEEETGLRCELGAELPSTHYTDSRGRPKRVRWWRMEPRRGRVHADRRGGRDPLADPRGGRGAPLLRPRPGPARRRSKQPRRDGLRAAAPHLREFRRVSGVNGWPSSARHLFEDECAGKERAGAGWSDVESVRRLRRRPARKYLDESLQLDGAVLMADQARDVRARCRPLRVRSPVAAARARPAHYARPCARRRSRRRWADRRQERGGQPQRAEVDGRAPTRDPEVGARRRPRSNRRRRRRPQPRLRLDSRARRRRRMRAGPRPQRRRPAPRRPSPGGSRRGGFRRIALASRRGDDGLELADAELAGDHGRTRRSPPGPRRACCAARGRGGGFPRRNQDGLRSSRSMRTCRRPRRPRVGAQCSSPRRSLRPSCPSFSRAHRSDAPSFLTGSARLPPCGCARAHVAAG